MPPLEVAITHLELPSDISGQFSNVRHPLELDLQTHKPERFANHNRYRDCSELMFTPFLT
jgi:hypothetical protein